MPPEISSIFRGFALPEVVSQTKYCCSLKVKILGWRHYCLEDKIRRILALSLDCKVNFKLFNTNESDLKHLPTSV